MIEEGEGRGEEGSGIEESHVIRRGEESAVGRETNIMDSDNVFDKQEIKLPEEHGETAK